MFESAEGAPDRAGPGLDLKSGLRPVDAWPVDHFLRVRKSAIHEMLKDPLYSGAHAAHALPAPLELLG
jgi:hypothetical protein